MTPVGMAVSAETVPHGAVGTHFDQMKEISDLQSTKCIVS